MSTPKISPIIRHISKRCRIGGKLLLFTRRNSHKDSALLMKLVTVNDVELRNSRFTASFHRMR